MMPTKEPEYKIKARSLFLVLFIILLLVIFQRWAAKSAGNYINEGNSKLASGDYNGALRDYYYSEKLDDGKTISYLSKVRRGEIFFKFGKFDEAEKELSEAVKEEKRRYEAYEFLGDLYYKKIDFNKAISFYNSAIQYNDGPQTKLGVGIKRAKTFISMGETELATNILKDLYSEVPESKSSKELLYYRGVLEFDKNMASNEYLDELRGSDEYKWKIEEIDNFIGKYNGKYGNGFSNVLVASLYNSIQEPYLAIYRIKKAISADDSYRDAWIMLGKSHFIIEDYASSLDDLAKALKLDGHDGETYFWLASVFSKIGNEKLASEYFSKYEIFK